MVDSVSAECSSIGIDTENHPHIAYCSGWLKYAQWNGIGWELQLVDTIGHNRTAKLYLDDQNAPHIAYFKDSCILKYAYYDGNSWQISKIDSFKVASQYILWSKYIDLKLFNGIPHISYSFINYNDSTRGIRYAFKSGDSWITQTVWAENRIPTPFLLTTAIDLDQTNYPIIAFENYYPDPIDSGYLFCTRFNGQNWAIDTIERHWYSNYYVYSLKTDIYNRIHIYYQRLIELFYAVKSSDTWTIEFVATNGWGECGGEMVLNEENPNVVYSSIRDPLTYAWKRDTMWYFEIIDSHYPGLYPSLAKDNEGGLHVSYTRFDDNCLLYAQRTPNAIEERVVSLKTEIPSVVYPNPAKAVMRVRCPSSVKEVKIFDVSGKLIKEIALPAGKNEFKISLKGINSGIYFLKVSNQTKKFLVVK
ncbi:MAG: T9SS type A sorting domain-containing protein [candidate division WOR-3 bacterium]